MNIEHDFRAFTGSAPFAWQARLYREHFANGALPSAVDVPTGLGKTSVMALWLIALARQWEKQRNNEHIPRENRLPRRLIYVVDRRAVVDQATEEAIKLRCALEGKGKHFAKQAPEHERATRTAAELKRALGLACALPISTLRGAFIDNREWREDPAAPAIIVGTVDMIGSRLLFEGYGVSRKMRPYQAGLLGADALVLLDEAHLAPPFQHLLRSIELEAPKWAEDGASKVVPPFRLLPLSATQRETGSDDTRRSFELEPRDWESDATTKKRLKARKHLRFRELAENADSQFADEAWRLATENGAKRVIVFCNKRTKNKDEKAELGDGPCADGVLDELLKRKAAYKKRKGSGADIELLVGARRQKEREGAAGRLKELGFIGGKESPKRPAFLVATSAGEVGVDIDADHMVSDLAPWERMVQRLGRVNRRGEGDAEVVVFWSEPKVKKEDEPTPAEVRALLVFAAKAALERLQPDRNGDRDASPGALRTLADDPAAKADIAKATTPEPLRPALNRALVEAWSMTSLEHHTGRPEVAPWLRGWVDEQPQTILVWRAHLPVRESVSNWPRTKAEQREIEDFFEAAPPHESEKLETETYHVVEWLQARATALLKGAPVAADAAPDENDDDVVEACAEPQDDADDATAKPSATPLGRNDIAAIVLTSAGDFARAYKLRDLSGEKKEKDELERALRGKTLILDARMRGLGEDGLLRADHAKLPTTADRDRENWSADEKKDDPIIRFRIEGARGLDDKNWRFRSSYLRRAADDPADEERLHVFKWRADAGTGEDASIIRNQSLRAHSEDTKKRAEQIADALDLKQPWRDALILAAYLHDAGKARRLWQLAMGKPPRENDPESPYAKTDGKDARLNRLKVNGQTFRHEFASLTLTEGDEALRQLGADARELALHLIVAHHGFARPTIFAFDPEQPPTMSEERARGVALRFARLQKRWGPWGLAWWEALLRAADQQASRALEDAAANKEAR